MVPPRKTQVRAERQRFADQVASRREKLGISQRELSRRLGWHEMTVHLIESCQRGVDITELVDLAKELGIDSVQLFELSVGRR